MSGPSPLRIFFTNHEKILPVFILGAALVACQLLWTKGAKGKDTFAGTWDTNWGTVELNQKGKTVDGTYEYRGTKGILAGEVINDALYFTWTEVKAGQTAEGIGYFVLKSEGYRIEGQWGQANERGDWNMGVWKGERVE